MNADNKGSVLLVQIVISNSIKRRRQELRATQKEVDARSNMGLSKYKEIENGTLGRLPSIADLDNISSALDFPDRGRLGKIASGQEPEYQPLLPERIVTLDTLARMLTDVLEKLDHITAELGNLAEPKKQEGSQ